MRINEVKEQTVDVEVYILDEKNDRDIYVKTIPVKTRYATFKLRTDTEELKRIFDKVIKQLNKEDKVTIIGRFVNSIGLEMVGEFEQIKKGRHEIFTLKFKLRS